MALRSAEDEQNEVVHTSRLTGEEYLAIQDIVQRFLEKGSSEDRPKFVLIMGGVATGKTTIRRKEYSDGYVNFDFGDILVALKSVIGASNPKLTDFVALAGEMILRASIDSHKNIVIEIIGETSEVVTSVINKMRALGYKVSLCGVDCDVADALERHRKAVEEDENYLSAYFTQEATCHAILSYVDGKSHWFLPKLTDYWDWTRGSLEKFSLELMMANPEVRTQHISAIRAAVKEHVRVLPDRNLLDVLYIVADDIFKAGNCGTLSGSAFEMYIEASAGTLYSLAKERGYLLHYLVDNMYEQTPYGMKKPLELYGKWFMSAGLAYICPQDIALSLMQHDKQDPSQYFVLLAKYIDEAIDVANLAVEKCHSEFRHYIFLNADCSPEPFPFKSSMTMAGSSGVVTALRNEAPVAGSKITVRYPQTTAEK